MIVSDLLPLLQHFQLILALQHLPLQRHPSLFLLFLLSPLRLLLLPLLLALLHLGLDRSLLMFTEAKCQKRKKPPTLHFSPTGTSSYLLLQLFEPPPLSLLYLGRVQQGGHGPQIAG